MDPGPVKSAFFVFSDQAIKKIFKNAELQNLDPEVTRSHEQVTNKSQTILSITETFFI